MYTFCALWCIPHNVNSERNIIMFDVYRLLSWPLCDQDAVEPCCRNFAQAKQVAPVLNKTFVN